MYSGPEEAMEMRMLAIRIQISKISLAMMRSDYNNVLYSASYKDVLRGENLLYERGEVLCRDFDGAGPSQTNLQRPRAEASKLVQ